MRASAQFNLGNMYSKGYGVTQDYVRAHMWLNLSAVGSPPGEFRDKAAKNRDIVAGRMTPAQVSEALARAWRPRKQVAATSSRPDVGGATDDRQRIVRIQRGLTSLGYDPGPADGIMGRKTRAAVRAFQAKMGRPVTGNISEGLEIAIRAAKRTVASTGTTPQEPVKKRSTGSGFVVSAEGHILTNNHVVRGCRTTHASTAGIVQPTGLKVLGVDALNDLALLKSAKSISTFVTFRGQPRL